MGACLLEMHINSCFQTPHAKLILVWVCKLLKTSKERLSEKKLNAENIIISTLDNLWDVKRKL